MGEPVDGLGKLVRHIRFKPALGRSFNHLVVSSADYVQGTRLSFTTKEDAIHFAEKQGAFLEGCIGRPVF